MQPPLILIVEDDQDSASLIDLTLKDLGMDLTWMFSIEEEDTMECIKSNKEKPSLIIISLSESPNKSFRLLKSIKGSEAGYDIPVVIYTSIFDPIDVEIAIDLKCDGYYLKEYGLEEMKIAIGDMLEVIRIHELSF